jgi:putative PEP-CTERM system histidine kinase
MDQFWEIAVFAGFLLGAITNLAASAWIYSRRARFGPAGESVLAGLMLQAVWCLAVLALGPLNPGTLMILSMTYLAWLWTLYRLFANDGRDNSVRPIRPVVMALGFVELLQLVLIPALTGFGSFPEAVELVFDISSTLRLLTCVGALVLVHNLYVGASSSGRETLRLPAAALGVMWLYDLNFYTVAYLSDAVPVGLGQIRGLVPLVMAASLTLAVASKPGELRLRPSRSVAFQSFSLLIIGGYLVSMVLVAQAIAYVGSDFARLIQIAFLAGASAAALMVLPSRKLRSWIRVVLAKHLFQHRYDYRAEWLRFTETISRGGEQVTPLHERVVQSLADITDSQSGLLLTLGEDGAMVLDSRWQWPGIDVPAIALSRDAAAFFEREQFILDLDDLREGKDVFGEIEHIPDWLREDAKAWAIVPLMHYQRLVALVVLSRPMTVRKLDWEDFDLLRVVGRQLASYLAEQSGQEALSEASRFDEFNRRIAFVMHDIKNLASQLSLLARNAEKHADNPEFRADMLVTLRNSSDKLNGLLARLGRYGAGGGEALERVDVVECVGRVVRRYAAQHPVLLAEQQPGIAMANAESLDQALVHLVQNAIDESTEESPVLLNVTIEAPYCRIEVVDAGPGMSAEFIRSRLFKPFHSSKPGGFGIGAFEARELIRAMNGRLDVESREGLGTRFIIRLPLAVAAELLEKHKDNPTGDTSPGTAEVA